MSSYEEKIKQIEDRLAILEININRLSEEMGKDRCILSNLQYLYDFQRKYDEWK